MRARSGLAALVVSSVIVSLVACAAPGSGPPQEESAPVGVTPPWPTGFIAVAPDLLSGAGPGGAGTEAFASRDDVVAAIRQLEPSTRTAGLDATRHYALSLPSASGTLGVVGFCWGGTSSFAYAVSQPELDAAVVFYGTSPTEPGDDTRVAAPVLGHYGADDARVNATVPAATEMMGHGGQSFAILL